MDVLQIVAIGIVATVLAITIKKQSPEIGLIVSIAGCVLIFLLMVPELATVLTVFQQIGDAVDTDMLYIAAVMKIIGIAYVAEFGAQICMDAGEGAIASKIDLAGKIMIMVVSAPILLSLLNMIFTILP